jgi:diguanylate cyclase (GGDEF)-like protein
MHPSHDNTESNLTAALIDQMLDTRRVRLRFPRPLEMQYEAETGAGRARLASFYIAIGTCAYLGSMAAYLLLMADRIGVWIIWTMVLIAALLVAIYKAISLNPPAAVRESLGAGAAVLYGLVVFIVVSWIPVELRQDYQYLFAVVLIAMLIEVRPPALFGALYVASALGLHLAAQRFIPGLDLLRGSFALSVTMLMGAMGFVVAHMLERNDRQNWLRSMRDRLRATLFEELSNLDPMTGLGNRRGLQQSIEKRRSAAAGEHLALVLVDIDHFKSYNDNYGHLAGDDCLQRVAGLLMSEARKAGDKVFRYGGEEFVILLAGLDRVQGTEVAERIRRAFAAARIPQKSPLGLPYVTASFGVASQRITPDFDFNTLMAKADAALYEAKRNGRNQVVPPLIRMASAVNG